MELIKREGMDHRSTREYCKINLLSFHELILCFDEEKFTMEIRPNRPMLFKK